MKKDNEIRQTRSWQYKVCYSALKVKSIPAVSRITADTFDILFKTHENDMKIIKN